MDWTHRLRLRNLQMLLSLAQTGNMSHSAEAMHTTQPGLSKWLKELEADVGMPLFERHARGLRPTAEGKALLAHARRIEAHLDNAREDMLRMREGGSGLVTIGFAGASSVDTVPMAVLRIREKLPTAHIRLLETKPEQLIEALSTGLMDIVVGPSELAAPDPQIRAEELYVEPIHLVARTDHPIFKLEQVGWPDVLRYPWALWAKGTPVRTAFDKALVLAGQAPPRAYVESNAATLTTTLLLNSDMIGVTSRRPAGRYRRMNLLSVIPLDLAVEGSITLYWREDAAYRLAVATALEGIREVVRAFADEDLHELTR
ncbi:LysR family transcriptional regulator [Hydrogenophaga sp.]|uniref:LysR family transcriptional regulator n=1 Tax=Hydrogenophaga sp. TaxID=1904254 RepID=UPI00261893B4|nr:LysR family transcriptional regulator [Hydrogenophaga sp.]MCW5656006.1 LysR family transcriptional regulator [Hydrogenophaga sp.]